MLSLFALSSLLCAHAVTYSFKLRIIAYSTYSSAVCTLLSRYLYCAVQLPGASLASLDVSLNFAVVVFLLNFPHRTLNEHTKISNEQASGVIKGKLRCLPLIINEI